jgi:hypothetical protein
MPKCRKGLGIYSLLAYAREVSSGLRDRWVPSEYGRAANAKPRSKVDSGWPANDNHGGARVS